MAQLLDYYYDGNPLDTIIKVMHELEGSFALGIVFADFCDTVYAVRCESPLIVGVGSDESFIAWMKKRKIYSALSWYQRLQQCLLQ